MLKRYRERDPVTHAETVKHINIWAPLQTIYYNLRFKHHQSPELLQMQQPNCP